MAKEVHLALYLDAPMQSWGHSSRYDRRTTIGFPTRSGMLGMVCAALGAERTDLELLERLGGLRMTTYKLRSEGHLTDYHTVGGGYDPKLERMNVVRKADGGWGKDPVQTWREYILGARFGVVLSGEEGLLKRIAHALRDPRWGIWFGRKCCIPASPLVHGLHPTQAEALETVEQLAGTRHRQRIEEVERFDEGSDTVRDVPLDFGERRFAARRVRVDFNE